MSKIVDASDTVSILVNLMIRTLQVISHQSLKSLHDNVVFRT